LEKKQMNVPPRTRRRWSNHDRHLGRFITYARDAYDSPLGIVVDSGEGEHPGCHLRLRGFGHTLLIELPPVVRPWRRKIRAESWDAATVQRLGRDWYWDEHAREYGFQLSGGGFLQVFLGRQTDDSCTEQRWSCFLPWTQWRFVRESWYGLAGEHIHTIRQSAKRGAMVSERVEFEMKKVVPTAAFAFTDFDGEPNTVTTHISEMEWRLGEKWFKWLSLFARPRVRRTLDLEFAKEVGPEKGSWKGGTLGHGIDMRPGELHEAAFRRYCEQEHRSKYRPFRITYVAPV
jgi:hypothetical protein